MEIESIKKNQPEMKNTLQGINSRVDEAENQISNLEKRRQKTPNENSKNKNKY